MFQEAIFSGHKI